MSGFLRLEEKLDELRTVVKEQLKWDIEAEWPVTESYSSTVLHFQAAGEKYILKKLFTTEKALREATWLQAHAQNPLVPKLLQRNQDEGWILLRALAGEVIQSVETITPRIAEQIGRALAQLHKVKGEDFDGFSSWHELLRGNMDRYASHMQGQDTRLASQAISFLERNFESIPNSIAAVAVHFDLRPGNVLVESGAVSGVIDFESMRGGHASMDFFKMWDEVWKVRPELMKPMLDGYGNTLPDVDDWNYLMSLYQVYHGLAGLAWCSQRQHLDSDFAARNRAFIQL